MTSEPLIIAEIAGVPAEDIELVERLIAKQRRATDETKQLVRAVLGLEASLDTAALRRQSPASRFDTPPKCDTHDTYKVWLPSGCWRCRKCHSEKQRKYTKKGATA